MSSMARWILCTFALVACAEVALPQKVRNRRNNKVLLGVVTAPGKSGLELRHVLPKSPADRAGLQVGDILTRVSGTRLTKPMELDDALRDLEPGAKIDLKYRRKKKRHSGTATVVERRKYEGDFLKPRGRGSTGFDAPEWFAYAWGNVNKKQKPPTRQNTKGKIVVIHAFQGW